MQTISPSSTPSVGPAADDFYPSNRFAKVPAEAFNGLACEGAHRLEHSEFRVFVALCRFRGAARRVNPSQETLATMTGMKRHNISRAVHNLAKKGWVVIHHVGGNPHKPVENYELMLPIRGTSPGLARTPRMPRKAVPAMSPVAIATTASAAGVETDWDLPDGDAAIEELDAWNSEPDSEPMTVEELDEAVALLEVPGR